MKKALGYIILAIAISPLAALIILAHGIAAFVGGLLFCLAFTGLLYIGISFIEDGEFWVIRR